MPEAEPSQDSDCTSDSAHVEVAPALDEESAHPGNGESPAARAEAFPPSASDAERGPEPAGARESDDDVEEEDKMRCRICLGCVLPYQEATFRRCFSQKRKEPARCPTVLITAQNMSWAIFRTFASRRVSSRHTVTASSHRRRGTEEVPLLRLTCACRGQLGRVHKLCAQRWFGTRGVFLLFLLAPYISLQARASCQSFELNRRVCC